MDAPKSPTVEIHPSLSPSLAASNAPRPSPSTSPSEKPQAGVEQEPAQEQEWYDPSKESWATRLGVNWESFKRAPGATACVSLSALPYSGVEQELMADSAEGWKRLEDMSTR